MATAATDSLTIEQFAEIAGDAETRTELVGGVLVEMPRPKFPHGRIVLAIGAIFLAWQRRHGGEIGSEDGIVIDDQTLRGPDVYYIPADRVDADARREGWWTVAPAVCVEVISPSELWSDIDAKLDDYFRIGVDEVWVIDPELRSLRLFTREGATRSLRGADAIPTKAMAGLDATVADLFDGIEA